MPISFYFSSTAIEKEKPQFSLNEEDKNLASLYLANLLWDDLKGYEACCNFDKVIQEMKELANKKSEPIDPKDAYVGLANISAKFLEWEEKENLLNAEKFLSEVSRKSNVKEIEKGKLYYEILQEGNGSIVTEDSSPLIHFKETNIEGEVLHSTLNRAPVKIVLSEAIRGFAMGLEGMHEGEKRRLYIHPDLAYRNIGDQPQQLLIFDVEILLQVH